MLECWDVEREMQRQFLADGGYFEGSLGYHLYVLNVLLFVHWLCRMAHIASPVREDILRSALAFAAQLTGPDGSVPKIGDWDDGYMFSPCFDYPHTITSMLSLGKTLLGMKDIRYEPRRLTALPHSQMACWRNHKNELIVFRAADVEHGHSHLDMLSLTYIGTNGPVILDGGTFQYNHSREKRNAYRGLEAHSTIIGDGWWPVKPCGLLPGEESSRSILSLGIGGSREAMQ